MIRVLHVVSGMNRGGLETFIMNVYRNIDRNKVQFDFLVHTYEEKEFDKEIESLGGKIYRVSPRSKGVFKNRRELNNFFSNMNYSIVHQHVSSLSYIEPLKIANKHGVKNRVIHSHSTRQSGHKIHKYIHLLNKNFINNIATNFFACSNLASKWMYKEHYINNHKREIIKNGIDTEKYIFDQKGRTKVRKELGIDDKIVIGHVGRFSFPKNHIFLIDIFIELLKLNKNCVLLLVGDGELKKQIVEKIQENKIEKNVILTGVRDDIPDLMYAMDAFVFPSIYEGLPISLVEAQSTGLKCFASNSITDEVIITDLVKTLDIKASSLYWAENILKEKLEYKRLDYSSMIRGEGYDIKNIATELQTFYLQ